MDTTRLDSRGDLGLRWEPSKVESYRDGCVCSTETDSLRVRKIVGPIVQTPPSESTRDCDSDAKYGGEIGPSIPANKETREPEGNTRMQISQHNDFAKSLKPLVN